MREKYPLAISASIIIVSFAIVIYFVTLGFVENETVSEDDKNIGHIVANASEVVKTTQFKTKEELKKILNATKEKIDNSPEIEKFQQLIENKFKGNPTKNKP